MAQSYGEHAASHLPPEPLCGRLWARPFWKAPIVKAAVLYQTNKPLIIEEIDIDELGPGWVKARTVSAQEGKP
jgi:hypothetical protein